MLKEVKRFNLRSSVLFDCLLNLSLHRYVLCFNLLLVVNVLHDLLIDVLPSELLEISSVAEFEELAGLRDALD
jgi:hypothetical protein